MTKQFSRNFIFAFIVAGFMLVASFQMILASNLQDSQNRQDSQNNLQAGENFTVSIEGSDLGAIPTTLHAGDTIVWTNNSTTTILLEQEIGFRVFLPLITSTNTSANTSANAQQQTAVVSAAQPKATEEVEIAAWYIEPGQSIEVRYKSANCYQIRVITDLIQEFQLIIVH